MRRVGRFMALGALAFGMTTAVLALVMQRDLSLYDEGLILVGATRVGDGAVPYRDFYANYGPAQFYVVAALFKVFGASVLTERAWDTVVRAAIVLVAFALVGTVAPRWVAWIGASLAAVWLGWIGAYGYPIFPCLLFSLAMVLCLASAPKGGRRSQVSALAAGAMAGMTALFRFDVGFYDAVVLLAAVLATDGRGSGRGRLGSVAPCLAGMAAVCGPAALALSAAGAMPALIFDNLAFPAANYARMRSLPFPSASDLISQPIQTAVYVPLIVSSLMGCAALRMREREEDRRLRRLVLVLALLSAAFYAKGLVRVSVLHMSLSLVPAILLAALALPILRDGAGRPSTALEMAACASLLVAVVPMVFACAAVVARAGENYGRSVGSVASTSTRNGSCRPPPDLVRIRCFEGDPAWTALVSFVQARSTPDQTIFSGLARHDRVFVNDVMLYFATDRRPATRWYHMDPGLQTTAPIQFEMIDDLRATRPALVILDDSWGSRREPNGSADSSGVTALDEFIAAHYRRLETFGPRVVYEPRP